MVGQDNVIRRNNLNNIWTSVGVIPQKDLNAYTDIYYKTIYNSKGEIIYTIIDRVEIAIAITINNSDPVAMPTAIRIENTKLKINGVETRGEVLPGSNIRFLTTPKESTYYANLTYELGVVVKNAPIINVAFESYTQGIPSDAFSTMVPSRRNEFSFTAILR